MARESGQGKGVSFRFISLPKKFMARPVWWCMESATNAESANARPFFFLAHRSQEVDSDGQWRGRVSWKENSHKCERAQDRRRSGPGAPGPCRGSGTGEGGGEGVSFPSHSRFLLAFLRRSWSLIRCPSASARSSLASSTRVSSPR